MSTTLNIELKPKEYERLRKLVYRVAGIELGDSKQHLVRSRLGKVIRTRGMNSYSEYFDMVEADPSGDELSDLIDQISTNTTHLFREAGHFEFLTKVLTEWVADPQWARGHGPLRIWSAACSSGEEPYSIAMTTHATLKSVKNLQIKILATDISTRILARAKLGQYEEEKLETVPPDYRRNYFNKVRNPDGDEPLFELKPEIRNLIQFSHFNLMTETFPFRNQFDVIFCRNVMIYFDKPTQERLVGRFARHLRPGGYLLIGHSESLNGLQHPYQYVKPTIYRR